MEAGEALEKAEKLAREVKKAKREAKATRAQKPTQKEYVIDIPCRRSDRILRNRMHVAREALLEQKEAEAKLAIMFCWLLGMLCMFMAYWAFFRLQNNQKGPIIAIDAEGNIMKFDQDGTQTLTIPDGRSFIIEKTPEEAQFI